MPEQLAAILPVVWKVARPAVVELVAVVLAPNDKLADAEDAGDVDGYLAQQGREVLRQTTPTELLNVAAVVADVLAAEVRGSGGEALERILAAVTGTQTEQAQPAPEQTSTPPSPTASPEPTGGAEGSPFTAPPTQSYEPSSSA